MGGLKRRSDRWRMVLVALILAGGQLAAAWLAVGGEVFWRLWSAPVLLAGTVLAAGIVLRPLGGKSILRAACLLAAAVLAGSGLVALENPQELVLFLPVIGGGAAGGLVVIAPSRSRCGGQGEGGSVES